MNVLLAMIAVKAIDPVVIVAAFVSGIAWKRRWGLLLGATFATVIGEAILSGTQITPRAADEATLSAMLTFAVCLAEGEAFFRIARWKRGNEAWRSRLD